MKKYEAIRLENQLCFPLYAVSKEIVRRYKPYLDELDLTYTQYLVMMVLWEKGQATMGALGKELYLDSGTLTPLLKKMEAKGYITRERMEEDERSVCISLTGQGEALKDRAVEVPEKMRGCFAMEPKEAAELYRLLHKLMDSFGQG